MVTLNFLYVFIQYRLQHDRKNNRILYELFLKIFNKNVTGDTCSAIGFVFFFS